MNLMPIPEPELVISKKFALRKWLPWMLSIIAVLVVVCGGVGIIGALQLFQSSQQEATNAVEVVDDFMKAGANGDAQAALNLFASASKGSIVTQDTLTTLFSKRNDIFDRYSEASSNTFSVTTGTSGTNASIQGTLIYEGGEQKMFTAMLQKEKGVWKLVNIRFPEGVGL